jgi:hypothetical protein
LPVSKKLQAKMLDHLTFLYGKGRAVPVWNELVAILREFEARNPDLTTADDRTNLAEEDTILITYGDQFQEPTKAPLHTLHEVLTQSLGCPASGVHILPFFP